MTRVGGLNCARGSAVTWTLLSVSATRGRWGRGLTAMPWARQTSSLGQPWASFVEMEG